MSLFINTGRKQLVQSIFLLHIAFLVEARDQQVKLYNLKETPSILPKIYLTQILSEFKMPKSKANIKILVICP